jgi:hypothetical protein
MNSKFLDELIGFLTGGVVITISIFLGILLSKKLIALTDVLLKKFKHKS